MNERVKYWLDLAEYDFETARAMLQPNAFYMLVLCAIRQ